MQQRTCGCVFWHFGRRSWHRFTSRRCRFSKGVRDAKRNQCKYLICLLFAQTAVQNANLETTTFDIIVEFLFVASFLCGITFGSNMLDVVENADRFALLRSVRSFSCFSDRFL